MEYNLLGFMLIIIALTIYCTVKKSGNINETPKINTPLLGKYVYVGIPWYQLHIKSYTISSKITENSDLIAQRYLYGKPYEEEIILEYWDEGIYRWKYPTNNMFTYFSIINYNPLVIEQTSDHNPVYTLLKIS